MQVETKTVSVFSHYPNGNMWTGSGSRSEDVHVDFSTKFRNPPAVTVALSQVDAGNAANLRVNAHVTHVTDDHCTIRVDTWADTKLASVAVTYVAVGE